jgi:DnaJ-domain-containing protein 1
MGIFHRAESVLKSYVNGAIDGSGHDGGESSADPDLAAAQAELDDFLNQSSPKGDYAWTSSTQDDSWDARFKAATGRAPGPAPKYKTPEEKLRPDYAVLEVPYGASLDTCRKSYRRLMKKNHPDNFAGNDAAMKAATAKSAAINDAWGRIEAFYNN